MSSDFWFFIGLVCFLSIVGIVLRVFFVFYELRDHSRCCCLDFITAVVITVKDILKLIILGPRVLLKMCGILCCERLHSCCCGNKSNQEETHTANPQSV